MLKYANQTHYMNYSTQSCVFLQVLRFTRKTSHVMRPVRKLTTSMCL